MSKIYKGSDLEPYLQGSLEESLDELLRDVSSDKKNEAINVRVPGTYLFSIEELIAMPNEYKTITDYVLKAIEEKLRASYLEILGPFWP